MVSTFLQGVAAAPINSAILLFCPILWFYMWNKRVPLDNVSISYRLVVEEKQYYRIISAAFVHVNLLHVVFNMGSLYSVGVIEEYLGELHYIKTTILLLLLSKAIYLGITHVAIKRFNRTTWADIPAVGYSAVIFGWMTVLQMYQPTGSIPLPGGFNIPFTIAPFVSLLITQLLVPRASFLGHLAGIIAGYALSFGLFDWLGGYWFWSSFVYISLFFIISMRANPNIPYISRIIQVSPEFLRGTGLGGASSELAGASGGSTVRRYMENGILRVFRSDNSNTGSENAMIQQRGGGQQAGWRETVARFFSFGGRGRQYNTLATVDSADSDYNISSNNANSNTNSSYNNNTAGVVGDTGGTVMSGRAHTAAAPSERSLDISPTQPANTRRSSPV